MDATTLQVLAERQAAKLTAKLFPPVLLAFDRQIADALLRRDVFLDRVSIQAARPSESMPHMSNRILRLVFETDAFTPDASISWSTRPGAACANPAGSHLFDRLHTWLGRAAGRQT